MSGPEARQRVPTESSGKDGAEVMVMPEEQRAGSQQSDLDESQAPFNTRSALWGWIILCFSTGPTSAMVNSYVTASIQAAANAVGNVPGTNEPCARRGAIRCVVKLGGHEVDYLSYLLYLRAISRAIEGVVSIITAGAADYSNYRKPMMMGSIYLFGFLALPFAALTGQSYAYLIALSVLYVLITVMSGMYTVIEGSYVPIFMRSAGWFRSPPRIESSSATALETGPVAKANPNQTWIKGSRVSVLGLLASNVGALLALLIGVIITYGRGSVKEGYFNYLLAITIAGSLTCIFGFIGQVLLPSVPGKELPKGRSIVLLPLRTWLMLLGSVHQYPNAFKLCVGWILWNTGYSNFLQLLGALFLETTGINRGSGVFTVYSFMMVIFACIGSLSWLFAFPYTRIGIKSWAYIFLSVNILCVFWGCLGISEEVAIGYKHMAEFFVCIFLFMSTSSALRSLNRVLFSSLIPKGSEALYFGLEITLDLATGWINPLVQGIIQSHTHNLRYPMIPNLFLMVVAFVLYVWTNVEQGIKDAEKPLEDKRVDEDST